MEKKLKRKWCMYTFLLLITLAVPANLRAQVRAIKGVVYYEPGSPLLGATVFVKGSTNGTITGEKGEFSIDAEIGDTLVVSYIGYITEELAVTGTNLSVTLREDIVSLDDVIVIGYGSVKKSDLTGSVSSVKMDKLKDVPANSIDGLLQGRSAGLQVINSSQDPGSGSTIRIRGESSLYGSNAPLVVVDGFPMGDAGNLKQINPSDIISIEILKDASASAIYGSRGANGVILITTNRAKAGTVKVNIKHQTSLSQFTSDLNTWDNLVLMAQLHNEGRINAGYVPLYRGITYSNGVYYPSVEEIESGEWPWKTNWNELVFRDSPVSNNTVVSVNSASETTSFNLSVNHFDEQGVYIEDDYKKDIVNLGVNHTINDFLSIRTSNILTRGYRHYNGGLAYYRNPLWPVKDEDGNYFKSGDNDYSNPMALTDLRKNETTTLDILSSWIAEISFNPYLSLRSQLNYKYGTYINDQYFPDIYTETGDANGGKAGMVNWLSNYMVSETYMTYDRTFSGKHHLTAMLGHSYESSMTRNSSLYAYGFVNESLGNESMQSGDPEMNEISNGYGKTKLVSVMGRINYVLLNRYLATFTMRSDGSSKFGVNNKWAYFPSGALSWKLHEEDFINNLGLFNELKLRVSYGISGNQGISAYQTLSRYGIEEYYHNGNWQTAIGPGYVSGYTGDDYRFRVWSGIPNEDLRWETTSQFDLGLDMAFFNRRLQLVLDYYQKHTSDLLRQKNLPLSSGYDLMWVNDGEIENKGFEITMTAEILSSPDYSLSSTLIYTRNRNKVLDLGDHTASGLNTDLRTGMEYEFWGNSLSSFSQIPNILAIGQPVNVFYGYRVDGILQSEDDGLAAGLTGDFAQPGEFNYIDSYDDGVIDKNDRLIIGDPNPDFIMSFSLNGRYKRFDMEVFLNGVFGNEVINYTRWGGQAYTSPLRWTQDNPNNEFPALRDNRTYYFSSWWIEDGSFLRIQNVNLGYNYKPGKLTWPGNLRIFLNASNLYTFSKFNGYDPEVGVKGIYSGGYPRLRKFTVGLDITF